MKQIDMIILILSCDKYGDCWYPMIQCLRKFWPECTYKKVLCTEKGKPYPKDIYDDILYCNYRSWSKMLIEACKQCESEFIFLLLEDQWPSEHVNDLLINNSLQLMKKDQSIGTIYFDFHLKKLIKDRNKEFNEIPFGTPYRLSVCPSIWRTSSLMSVLKEDENAWDFERIGSFRNESEQYKVMFTSDTAYTRVGKSKLGAIEKGKWEPEIMKFAKENEIEVNFYNRPIKTCKDIIVKKTKDVIFNISPEFVVKIQNMVSKK